MNIYLVYNYEEHGIEDYIAVSDKENVVEKCKIILDDDEINLLTELLSKPDIELMQDGDAGMFDEQKGAYKLSKGWGGWIFKVLEVY